MRNERSISLPGLLLGFSVDGGVAAVAVPAAARTVLSLPQAALGDGTAQASEDAQDVGVADVLHSDEQGISDVRRGRSL